MTKYAAQAKYNAKTRYRVVVNLNTNTDQDIIRHVEKLDNVQGYIKGLIRKDMEQNGCEYCAGEAALYQQNSAGELHLGTFGDNRTLEFTHNACPPHAACSAKYLKNKAVYIINNCPNCGRKL